MPKIALERSDCIGFKGMSVARALEQLCQQLCHGRLTGDDQEIWSDFMKRYENERAVRETRMGDVQIGLVQDEVSVEQDVEIEGARTVENTGGTLASEVVLDAEESCEKRGRGKIRFESNHGVEEAGLIGKSHGSGGVKRRAAAHVANRRKAIEGSRQCGFRRAGRAGYVGTHPDVSGLHGFRVARKGRGRPYGPDPPQKLSLRRRRGFC